MRDVFVCYALTIYGLIAGDELSGFRASLVTTVRIVSHPCDFGRLVIRSIETYWNGPCSTCVLKKYIGAHFKCVMTLDS
jgi:hypothetical protein